MILGAKLGRKTKNNEHFPNLTGLEALKHKGHHVKRTETRRNDLKDCRRSFGSAGSVTDLQAVKMFV